MKTVLVSGASGVVGYGILRSLISDRENYNLIGTTYKKLSIAPAFCDVLEIAPLTTESFYIDWLCEVIKKHKVDVIIPGIEIDMFTWNEHRDEILSSGATPLLNSLNAINLCQDKWIFYESLINFAPQYAIPTSINLKDDTFEYPYLLKPRRGFGSKGIFRVYGESDSVVKDDLSGDAYLMQPLIGDDDNEYTVSGFFCENSILRTYIAFKRSLSSDGYTEMASVVDYDFYLPLVEIANMVKPIGPTNFQFRLDSQGNLRLLEVNPRISSSTSIRALFGYNESIMSINYFLSGILPEKFQSESIQTKTAVRYIDERIIS